MFDTDTPAAWSAAQRTLDELGRPLREQIALETFRLTDLAESWTKDQIVKEAAALGLTLKHAPKADMVKTYVNQAIKGNGARQELDRLELAANRDKYLARRLEDVLDTAEANLAKFRAALDGSESPRSVTSAFAWNTDAVMQTQALAQFALMVVTEVSKGAEIRDSAMRVGKHAMRLVMGFPSHVMSNGTGSAHRLEATAEAAAAVQFVELIGYTVFDDTVPAEWLSR